MGKGQRTIEHDLFGGSPKEEGINSQKKGSKNELAAANWCGLWFGGTFHRVPRSGGLHWKNVNGITGDIISDDAKFPFCVETKFYKRVFVPLYLRNNSIIYKFWEQVYHDADSIGAYPLLIVRENGMPKAEWYIFMELHLGQILDSEFDCLWEYEGYREQIVGYRASTLLENVDGKAFVRFLKK